MNPEDWFLDFGVLMAAAMFISGRLVYYFTALAKRLFGTTGQATVWLSLLVAVVIAGWGGYFALGQFDSMGGLQGALRAAAMALWAWLQANGEAHSERQAQKSAIEQTQN